MFPSRPSRRAFVENLPSNACIFVILDTFRVLLCCLGQLINVQALWSVPPQNEPFISENCWWFKSQNDDKITKNLSFARLFARIFAKIAPVFLRKLARLKNWKHCILCSWQAMILAIIELSFFFVGQNWIKIKIWPTFWLFRWKLPIETCLSLRNSDPIVE